MRFVLILSLVVAQCASAIAAPAHHHPMRRHVFPAASRAMMPPFAAPAQNGIDPTHPPVLEDQTPSPNDPSKFGGG